MGGVRIVSGGSPPGAWSALSRVFAGIVIVALAVPLLSGWKVTGTQLRTVYYPISGRDHAEILRSVRRFGPKNGFAYGMGFIEFHPDYDTAAEDGKCRITRAETGLRILLKLPEWKGPDDAPRSAARLGRNFERAIKSHEMQHVKIAERYAAKISRDLKKLKPADECWTLRSDARELIERIKDQHWAAQKAFDRRTRKQIKRLL